MTLKAHHQPAGRSSISTPHLGKLAFVREEILSEIDEMAAFYTLDWLEEMDAEQGADAPPPTETEESEVDRDEDAATDDENDDTTAKGGGAKGKAAAEMMFKTQEEMQKAVHTLHEYGEIPTLEQWVAKLGAKKNEAIYDGLEQCLENNHADWFFGPKLSLVYNALQIVMT